MSADPGFIFYPGDYLRDTQCLSEKSQVAYDRIMCEHMRNICISQQQLKFFTKRLNEEELAELMMILTEKPEGFFITWVVESIEKRRAYSDSRRKNRSGSESKSNKKDNNISKTYVPHMDNENEIENINDDKGLNTNIIDVQTKKTELVDTLVSVLGFNEEKYILNKKIIFAFVNTQLKTDSDIDHFIAQFKNYKEYKRLSGEKEHNFTGYFGTQAMQFQNSAWNSENWRRKLDEYKSNANNQSKFEKVKTAFNAPNPYRNNEQ